MVGCIEDMCTQDGRKRAQGLASVALAYQTLNNGKLQSDAGRYNGIYMSHNPNAIPMMYMLQPHTPARSRVHPKPSLRQCQCYHIPLLELHVQLSMQRPIRPRIPYRCSTSCMSTKTLNTTSTERKFAHLVINVPSCSLCLLAM